MNRLDNRVKFEDIDVRKSQLHLLFLGEYNNNKLLDASHSIIDCLVVNTQSNIYINQCINQGYINMSS